MGEDELVPRRVLEPQANYRPIYESPLRYCETAYSSPLSQHPHAPRMYCLACSDMASSFSITEHPVPREGTPRSIQDEDGVDRAPWLLSPPSSSRTVVQALEDYSIQFAAGSGPGHSPYRSGPRHTPTAPGTAGVIPALVTMIYTECLSATQRFLHVHAMNRRIRSSPAAASASASSAAHGRDEKQRHHQDGARALAQTWAEWGSDDDDDDLDMSRSRNFNSHGM